MFVYKSPKSGNNAMIDSITPGKVGVSEVVVNWAGGGQWPCDRTQLAGNVKEYDSLPFVPQATYDEAMASILGGVTNEPVTETE
jgi:hypothetical protein